MKAGDCVALPAALHTLKPKAEDADSVGRRAYAAFAEVYRRPWEAHFVRVSFAAERSWPVWALAVVRQLALQLQLRGVQQMGAGCLELDDAYHSEVPGFKSATDRAIYSGFQTRRVADN